MIRKTLVITTLAISAALIGLQTSTVSADADMDALKSKAQEQVKKHCKGDPQCEQEIRQKIDNRKAMIEEQMQKKCGNDEACREELRQKYRAKMKLIREEVQKKCGDSEQCQEQMRKEMHKRMKNKNYE